MPAPPFILLLDDESGSLTDTALDLVRLGLQVLYTRWADEGLLLVEQEAGQVGLLIAPCTVRRGDLAIVRTRLTSQRGDRGAPLLVIHPAGSPDEPAVDLHATRVLRWPFNRDDLRFAVNALIGEPGQGRRATRDPGARELDGLDLGR